MVNKKFKQTEIGEIPEDWEVEQLQKVCLKKGIQTGPFGSQLHNKDYVLDGTPIITVEHLGDNRILHENLPRVSETDRLRLSNYSMIEGDIIFSRVGSVDRRAIAKKSEEGWLFSGRCLRVRTDQNKVDPSFLSYFFGLESFKERIRGYAVGATMPSLNTKLLSEMMVVVAPLSEQHQIAKILSDLDSQIEVLQQQNETLEAIGKALFKHWFVDFEFPNEKGKPYKSSGGSMVDSELGEIPKGWEVTQLRTIIQKNRLSIKDYELWKDKDLIDLSNIPPFSMSITEFDKGEKFKSNIFELKEFDILFGAIRPYFGKYGFSPINGVITGTVYSFNPKEKGLFAFTLFLICRKEFVDFTVEFSKGTKMPIIGWDDFCSYKFAMPNIHIILIQFNEIMEPILNKMKKNIQEIIALQKIRDSLLPKLMTGKIRVPVEVHA